MLRRRLQSVSAKEHRPRAHVDVDPRQPSRPRASVDARRRSREPQHSVRGHGARRVRDARRRPERGSRCEPDCRPSPCATFRSSVGKTTSCSARSDAASTSWTTIRRSARWPRASRERGGRARAAAPHARLVETPFQRAGVGNGLFSGENPPFGALLSYVLDSATPTGSEIVLLIKDAAGKTIDEVPGPGGAGLNRAVWNLRHAPDTASLRADVARVVRRSRRAWWCAGRHDWRRRRRRTSTRGRSWRATPPGPLVVPGTYTVQLARRAGATLTAPIGAPQRLRLNPLSCALAACGPVGRF